MVSELVVGALLALLVFGMIRFQDGIVSLLTRTGNSGRDRSVDEP